ncbi:NAD-dependent protein deacetylase sirtuin-2-like isoform X2 [Rhodnius prolixus]|uniref:NAD-dependent protein deacetylase sirtuin-2-like isoform X2 n=1 Tax=Rhodnius prolixus TaxID=13249 RepID=UPI003D1891AB
MSSQDKELEQEESRVTTNDQQSTGEVPSNKDSDTTDFSKDKELASNSPKDDSLLEELMHKLTLAQGEDETEDQEGYTLEKIGDCYKNNQFQSVITMVGAGISTAAGIPDFRSPGKGLYHNLAKYNLPYPQAIFELVYFLKQPEPFFQIARELFPGSFHPTAAHYFLKLLQEKGLLLRHYTQNIDNLERTAGLPEEKLIEAHGTFYRSHCVNCKRQYTLDWMKEKIFTTDVPLCESCGCVVRPDIVFFGEALPAKFYNYSAEDFGKCDLLIVMGSSLTVEPFASLVRSVKRDCPRIVINDRPVGHTVGISYSNHSRDVFIEGSCDDGCRKLAATFGWTEDYERLLDEKHITA